MPKLISPETPEGELSPARSMSDAFETKWFDLRGYETAFIQVEWTGATGTLNGELYVECSNLRSKPSRFERSLRVVDSADDEQSYNIWNIAARYYRVIFVPRGITGGTIKASVSARGV